MQFMGTVTKVEWTNPHARFYLDVKDARGAVTNWNFELGSPILLRKLGWKQDSLKIGEQVSVEGYLAKDGAKMANAGKVTLADGRNIFAGSSAGDNPPRQFSVEHALRNLRQRRKTAMLISSERRSSW